jgi:hypothetical protein
MIQFVLHRTQAGYNISKAFSVGELGKGHAKKLVQAGEVFHIAIAGVSINALVKLTHREKVHQLGEYESSCIHRPFPPGDDPGLWPKFDFQVDADFFVGKFMSY